MKKKKKLFRSKSQLTIDWKYKKNRLSISPRYSYKKKKKTHCALILYCGVIRAFGHARDQIQFPYPETCGWGSGERF